MYSLEAKNLSKWRDHYCVFSDVSFSLNSGESLWIRGDNGAGKTSLIRILAGLSKANDGELLWNNEGFLTDNSSYQGAIHYLSHQQTLIPHLTVLESIQLLFPMLGAKAASDISLSLNDVGLAGFEQHKVQNLSAGQKQRLSLLRLLLRNKPLWILDEPQSHLDREGQAWLFDTIERHISNKGMVIIISHAKDLPLTHVKSLDL